MNLPARSLGYVRDLHRRGLVRGTIRSALEDWKRFGADGPLRYALGVVGGLTYMTVRYPGTRYRFQVRPTPFWKNWKQLESGSQDFESLQFLASHVKPGQIVFDVGAWEGPYSLLIAELVGPGGRVYAFEPDPKAFATLRDNVHVNGLPQVHLEDWCLSNVDGPASFFDAGGGTIGSLVRNELVAELPLVDVRTTTVDRYCRDHAIRVDGMKLDVEGAEALVVEGARDVIKRFSPWIFLEFHGVLMSERERQVSWAEIVEGARDMTFVHGDSRRYRSGDELDSYPDCDYFHSLIQY